MEVIIGEDKRLRPTKERHTEKEVQFELVEMDDDQYSHMIRQLERDLELCKKFRQQRREGNDKRARL